MKRFFLTLLLVPGLLSACSRRTHASTNAAWNLSLSKPGSTPRMSATYRWADQARRSCRLRVQATSKDVEVPKDITMVLSLGLTDENVNRSVLTLRVEDLVTAQGSRPALWANPIAFEWVVTNRGRTLSFRQDSEGPPVVLSGLPDLEILFSRLIPTFPAKKVGTGAAWSKQTTRDLTIPGPTGFGTVRAHDRTAYTLGDAKNKSITISGRGTASYEGTIHPVGHMLTVDGKGTFTLKANLQNGVVAQSILDATEAISLVADGQERTVRTQYKATLRCTTSRATAPAMSSHPRKVSQRDVTPKSIASRPK